MATFHVEELVEIPERGGVLAGTVVDGTIRSGQKATLRTPDGSAVELEIQSVEFMDTPESGMSRVALLFRDAPAVSTIRPLVSTGALLTFE